MGHPTIDEFCRAHDFQAHFLRRCQRVFRDEVQPQLDERDVLLTENAALKAEIDTLKAKPTKAAKSEAA